MKKPDLIKISTIAVLSMGLMAGCTTTTEEAAPAPETTTEKECPSAEAKNAIYAAKIKQARAVKLGYAWRDTAELIEAAEKAAADCDNDTAISLANRASEQAGDAIAQYYAEQKRYEESQSAVEADPEPTDEEYTVESGDNLWNISGNDSVYGNPYQWPLIYKANTDQIDDADLIFPGQTLTIPGAPSSSEIDAAVQHAKTRGSWSIGEVEQSDKDYLAQ